MGWRTDQNYEDMQRADERAYIASLPWHKRLLIRVWHGVATCIVVGIFCGLVWAQMQ